MKKKAAEPAPRRKRRTIADAEQELGAAIKTIEQHEFTIDGLRAELRSRAAKIGRMEREKVDLENKVERSRGFADRVREDDRLRLKIAEAGSAGNKAGR